MAQARQPWFYANLGVPDTVEGRYDMIMLHSFLVIEKMSGQDSSADVFAQKLFDELFKDMDRSLREMGVGDLSVPKKIRKMAEAFYGRAAAYREALGQAEYGDACALKTALARNIYVSNTEHPALDELTKYVLKAAALISDQSAKAIAAGEIKFPEIEST